jgi:hypothetical protein
MLDPEERNSIYIAGGKARLQTLSRWTKEKSKEDVIHGAKITC